MADQLFPVPFHEDTLVLVAHGDQPFVAMKPIVENMGLAWVPQYVKLTEKFGSVVTIIITTGGDGKQYEMISLPLRKLPAWLYSINPNKVAPALREKIIRYQDECDEVLWQYWTNGFVSRPGVAPPTIIQQISAHKHVTALMKELKVETIPAIRETLYAQLQQACRMSSLPCPPLEAIGCAVLPQRVPALVETFWETVELIGLEKLNHCRTPGLIGINLMHFHQAAAAERIKLPPVSEFRHVLRLSESPRLVEANRVVSSLLWDRAVRCWVFAQESSEEVSS